MMSRKKPQVFNTYGRHRQRVVEVLDVWARDGPKPRGQQDKGLFSSFSSNDSNPHNDTSSICLEKREPKRRLRKCKTNNKENIYVDPPSWIVEQKPKKKASCNESVDSADSDGIFKPCGRVLRDRSANKSTAVVKKTTGKKKTMTAGPKSANITRRATRRTANVNRNTTQSSNRKETRSIRKLSRLHNQSTDSIETSRHAADPRLDFTEFEKYSLLIASPLVEGDVIGTPDIESAVTKKTVLSSHEDALTSTPHCDREEQIKCNLFRKMNMTEGVITDFSHIMEPDDSPEFIDPVSRITRSRALHQNEESILDCSEKLEQLSISMSRMSSISSSGSNYSNHDTRLESQRKFEGSQHHSPGHRSTPPSGGSSENPKSQYDPSQSLFEVSHVSMPPVNNLYVTQRRNTTRLGTCDEARFSLSVSTESSNESEAESLLEDICEGIHTTDSTPEESEEEYEPTELDAIEEESAEELSEEEYVDISDDDVEIISEKCSQSKDMANPTSDLLNTDMVNPTSDQPNADVANPTSDQLMNCSVHEHLEDLKSAINHPDADFSGDQDSLNRTNKSHCLTFDRSSYHTCPSTQFTTPISRVLQIRNEVMNSGSLRTYLTPVKVQPSEEVTPKDKVLTLCGQVQPISFTECIPPAMMKKCKKIGEGVYGEVFRSERNKESVALKIIPIEGNFPVNDEPQKTFAEILPEIVISKELSGLRDDENFTTENFVQVKRVSVVQGSYPGTLLKQWDIYHNKKVSENDRPDVFDNKQLFLIFEFNDCGSDLESVALKNLHQAKSIIYQVTCSLAIAEERLQFEHRDLHWGNVLVKPTDEEFLSYTLEGEDFCIESKGVKVSVIDFTLSRLSKDGCNVFTDLSVDPTLFEGQGDYQFEVYRLMRDENGNKWDSHKPYSNVLWIHYLTDKLLQGKTYSGRDNQSLRRQFRTFVRETTEYNSALHLLSECPFFQGCVIKS